jgi:spermidine/putrescine-binding protein
VRGDTELAESAVNADGAVKGVKMLRKTMLTVLATLLLAACGGGGGNTESGAQQTDGAVTTSTGFVCPEPSPRVEVTSTQLNLFVWTEYIPPDIIDCFEQLYGVTVNREEYSSNEEMYAKLSTGATTYDLAQPSDNFLPLMIRQGLIQKLDASRLPNLANIAPQYLPVHGDETGEYAVPYMAGTQSIVVNTAAVEAKPTSWADMWNPAYAGRMVFVDDPRVTIGMALLAEGKDPNTTDPAELAAVKPKVAELVQNVRIFDSDSPKSAIIAGDADLGMVWTAEAELANRELGTVEFIYPSEGQFNYVDSLVMLTDAPYADAVYAFVNYVLQGDVFWKMLEDFPYIMPNQAALAYAEENQPELYEAYINSPITNTPAEVWEKGHWVEDIGEATPLYEQMWTELKGR